MQPEDYQLFLKSNLDQQTPIDLAANEPNFLADALAHADLNLFAGYLAVKTSPSTSYPETTEWLSTKFVGCDESFLSEKPGLSIMRPIDSRPAKTIRSPKGEDCLIIGRTKSHLLVLSQQVRDICAIQRTEYSNDQTIDSVLVVNGTAFSGDMIGRTGLWIGGLKHFDSITVPGAQPMHAVLTFSPDTQRYAIHAQSGEVELEYENGTTQRLQQGNVATFAATDPLFTAT
jgi:hypothetical protein